MQLAKIIGNTNSTVKHESMQGAKLLVVQPVLVGGEQPDGFPFIAVDTLGAGKGQTVIISSDGRYARESLNADRTPVRWSVVGLCD